MGNPKQTYYLDGCTFFRFSLKRDSEGSLVPPKAIADIPSRIPVYFEAGEEVIGWASAQRIKNTLVANIELHSIMKDTAKALELIRMLYPCPILQINAIDRDRILGFDLKGIVLSINGNADESIEPIGINGVLRLSGSVLN